MRARESINHNDKPNPIAHHAANAPQLKRWNMLPCHGLPRHMFCIAKLKAANGKRSEKRGTMTRFEAWCNRKILELRHSLDLARLGLAAVRGIPALEAQYEQQIRRHEIELGSCCMPLLTTIERH